MYRNDFGAIRQPEAWVTNLIKALDGTAWTQGIESDWRQRGSSINVDVYSYCSRRRLAVVQVRECQFRPNRYNKVRKQYYLCGWNENGNAFAHPVDSVARSKTAMNTYEGGVVLALSRIWDCKPEDVDKVKRNGDVAFVPCTPPIGAVPALQAKIVLAGSHVLTCERIQIKDGVYYAYGPASIRHTKRQHKAVRVGQGCWRVMVGLRFQKWGFSEPTAD